MRFISRSVILSVLAVLAIMLSQQSAAASDISTSRIDPIENAEPGLVITQDLTVDLVTIKPPTTFTAEFATASSSSGWTGDISVTESNSPVTITLSLMLTDGDIAACFNYGYIWFDMTVHIATTDGFGPQEYENSLRVTCSVLQTEATPLPPTQVTVCGPNNDIVTTPTQPNGVLVEGSDIWDAGLFLVRFFPDQYILFPQDTQTEYWLVDDNTPCTPFPPTVVEVCGPDNDVVTIPEQPLGVLVESSLAWIDGTLTVDFIAAPGYLLNADDPVSYTLRDEALPCGIVPVEPVQTAICGPDNDTISIPEQPVNVLLESDSDWIDGTRTITFVAAAGFTLDPGAIGEFSFVDEATACQVNPEPTTSPSPPPTLAPIESPTVEPTPVLPTTVATESPTTAPPSDSPTVRSLPNTGSGNYSQVSVSAVTLAAIALGMIAIGLGRDRARQIMD